MLKAKEIAKNEWTDTEKYIYYIKHLAELLIFMKISIL